MAINPQKRQKQLAKKKAKRKASVTAKKMTFLGNLLSHSVIENAPIHECFAPDELFSNGIGTVVISRKMPNGKIGIGFFLLDIFCLGVKNADFQELSPPDYQQLCDDIERNENLQPSSPAYARKLVEECADYAKSIGMEAHSDYKKAKKIFGNINSEDCSEEFVFGKDGKPFYMNGPYDTPEKIRKTINKLTKICGSDGFHYLMTDESFDDEENDPRML
ncbi:MAG: hypothetical protein KAI83_11170 [Thiomargarita sp.]|nr:hypothetical protein [Thiomargarita sp.]